MQLFELLVADQKPAIEFSEEELDTIAANALLDPAAKVNPVDFDAQDVKEIVRQCYEQ
jgi:alcohol dehydrogenase class IV